MKKPKQELKPLTEQEIIVLKKKQIALLTIARFYKRQWMEVNKILGADERLKNKMAKKLQ